MITLNDYAKQSQEIFKKKLTNEYEPIEDVSKRMVENLKLKTKQEESKPTEVPKSDTSPGKCIEF